MTRYAILCEVEVLHDYCLNRGSLVHEALEGEQQEAVRRRYAARTFLEMFPTEHTEKLLAGHKMLFKTTAAGFLVAVQMDASAADHRPAVPPGADFRLTFALRIRDPRFFNYTELAASAPGFYRLTNESGNAVADSLFLSAPVPTFDPARAYEAGEVYADSVGSTVSLFRAIRDTGPSAIPLVADWERLPPDPWNASTAYARRAVVLFANRLYRALVDHPGNDLADVTQWEPLGILANQYVTTADSLVCKPALFYLDLSGAALPQATIRLFRPGVSTAVSEHVYAAESGTLGVLQLDLRALVPGVYRLEVLDSALTAVASLGFALYLDSAASSQGWFGVIEIAAGSGALALLDSAGTLRSPRYTLRFLNRSTRWRYIFPSAQLVGAGAEVAPEGSDNRILITALPRPLTRFGTGIRLQADVAGTPAVSEEVLLPEPEANRIRRQNTQWYSEIHVSNLPL
jgi:hypothetical protein